MLKPIKDQIDQYFAIAKTHTEILTTNLDLEDVIITKQNSQIFVDFNNKDLVSPGIYTRLDVILPYIMQFSKENPNNNFKIILSLGDEQKKDYNTTIPHVCFTRPKSMSGILIPNIDFFTGHMKTYFDIARSAKPGDINRSIFCGASTGPLKNNTRIEYCLWSLDQPEHEGYITHLVQHSLMDFYNEYPAIKSVLTPYKSLQDQLRYDTLVNIDGNTLCWSRLYWQIASSSLPVYVNRTLDYVQFFDYYDPSECYIELTLEDCKQGKFDVNNFDAKQIIKNGQNYYTKVFSEYVENPTQYLQDIINRVLLSCTN